MTGLSKSQWRSIGAIALAVVTPFLGSLIQHKTDIESALPAAKWLPDAFQIVLVAYAACQRSLYGRRAGTGVGLLANTPDTQVATPQTAPAAPTALVPVSAPAALDEPAQALLDIVTDVSAKNYKKAMNDAAQALLHATNNDMPSADKLESAHQQIKQEAAEAKARNDARDPATPLPPVMTRLSPASEAMPAAVSVITNGTAGPAAAPTYDMSGEGA